MAGEEVDLVALDRPAGVGGVPVAVMGGASVIGRPTVSLMNSLLRRGMSLESMATVRIATTLQPRESRAPTPLAPAW